MLFFCGLSALAFTKGAGVRKEAKNVAKITTGSSFGLNAKQAQAARLMAEGKSVGEIVLILYGVTRDSNRAAYDKGCRTLRKWQALPGFADCYRAIVREIAMPSYGRALNRIDKQIDDPNPWIAQGAAREVLTRFGPAIMGEDDKSITVKVEGMPVLGVPGEQTTGPTDKE